MKLTSPRSGSSNALEANIEPNTTPAERLLHGLHGTCSHDLPNQMLSLQSLINLMDMDEVERLDPAGREYLQRLKAVADKMSVMVEFLRAMVRLARHVPQPRDIDLSELFRELKAEARSVIQTPLTWDFRLLATQARGDYDLIYPSLGDLLRTLVETHPPDATPSAKAITVTSAPMPGHLRVELTVRGHGVGKMTAHIDKRCEFVLAQERLRVAGVALSLATSRTPGDDGVSAILEFEAER